MKTELYNLKQQLEDAISKENDYPGSIEKLKENTAMIDDALGLLKSEISRKGFDGETDEISFFKAFKPGILSLKIHQIYTYNLKLNEPVDTRETITKYYASEIKSIQSFFRINAFHYQYFKNNLNDMDTVYFIRNAAPLALPTEDVNDLDPVFSTPMSLLFAKFLGYESVQKFCLQQIAFVSETPGKGGHDPKDGLKWTGDSINIVELAYGLYLTGQLNYGNASLNQIVRWLEANLEVKIGSVQRRFTEIGSRKRLSQTKYIDQMKDNILHKIDQGNA